MSLLTITWTKWRIFFWLNLQNNLSDCTPTCIYPCKRIFPVAWLWTVINYITVTHTTRTFLSNSPWLPRVGLDAVTRWPRTSNVKGTHSMRSNVCLACRRLFIAGSLTTQGRWDCAPKCTSNVNYKQNKKMQLLTQKMKLRKKSKYLINLVQPSTPIFDRSGTEISGRWQVVATRSSIKHNSSGSLTTARRRRQHPIPPPSHDWRDSPAP